MSNKVTYKNYNMNQLEIPMDISEWIEESHISRLVNMIIEEIEDKKIETSYKGGGRSAYHPKMMLKIIIYAYINKTTSGRKIEKLCQENIPMIWLAARQKPDFRTINRFRKDKKELIEEVFKQIVLHLIEQGLVDPTIYYLDGTKIEANANKYSFVWKKSIHNYKNKIEEKLQEFLEEANNITEQELKQKETVKGIKDLKELSQTILQNIEKASTKEIKEIVETLEEIQEQQEQENTSKERRRAVKKNNKKTKRRLLAKTSKI